MVQWRGIHQEEVKWLVERTLWKHGGGGVFGEVQSWRGQEEVHAKDVVRRWNGKSSKKRTDISLENRVKIVGQEFSHGSENTVCREYFVCRQGDTEEEGVKQQQRMKIMTRKMKSKGGVDANNSWWVSELRAAGCKTRGFIQNGRIQCSDGRNGSMK